MYFEQISTPGLGCFSYAVGCPLAGLMAVVDPRLDAGIYLRLAEENGMRITYIFDSHIHADHVSGARELRALTGADIYIHESAPVAYESKKLKNGDTFQLGNVFIRVLHTPGHTPDSVSFLISDLARSPEPEMILTGDLLFVGDVGRPDLPGEDILDEQTENLYNSLYKTLGLLPEYLEVYPAHGQGSLCGQGMSAKPSSTLGYERLANPMLNYADFKDFKRSILSNLPVRPQSFSGIIAANVKGATLLPKPDAAAYALSADKADVLHKAGAVFLDLRDALSYGAAHVPGSIHVDFSNDSALNWIGTVVTPGVPLVLVLPADKSFGEIHNELRRIGYDTVQGWLEGGLQAWLESGRETQGLPRISAADLQSRLAGAAPPTLIDVRSPEEFNRMKIKGSMNLPLNRIPEKGARPFSHSPGDKRAQSLSDDGSGTAEPLPQPALDTEAVIVCQSGFRAGIAASLLQAQGYTSISVLSGGLNAWDNPL